MTRDPLDDLGPHEAGLIELLNHLTSEPATDELSGQYAALTMFRAARRESASAAAATVVSTAQGGAYAARRRTARRRTVPRRTSRARVGGRLVAAAAAVALAGSFAAAGYAEVLPSSLQHLAHQLLGFAGVPNPAGTSSSAKPTVPVTSHRTTPGGSGSPQPRSSAASHSSRTTSPSPHRSRHASPSPTASALRIAISQVRRPHGRSEVLVVAIPQARRGDVVRLEELIGGQWQVVLKHRLHPNKQTKFTVVARKISVTYRVVVPATVKHGQAIGPQVTVAARPRKGGRQGGD